ncbi:RusA family crossover junction endodeoxyribonuclease [Corynebacterium striatum]
MSTISFFVDGVPAPQGSKTGFIRNGRVVLTEASKKVKPWRTRIANQSAECLDKPLEVPVRVFLEFVMPRPKYLGSGDAPPMSVKPDLDKLVRSSLDGITGTILKDDSLVVSLEASKRRARPGEQTGAFFMIREIAHEKAA